MTYVVAVSVTMLCLAAALCVAALIRPTATLADRAVALDTLVAIIISGLAAGAVATADGTFADLALVLGLLGFLATTTIARYISRRGL